MRLCLISAATVTDFGEQAEHLHIRQSAEHVPLGILTLAAILRQEWPTPAIVDLNRLFYEYLRKGGINSEEDFCSYAASQIPSDFDVIGLSTICSSYPLTIRLAEKLKRAQPEAVIMLGGPQASAVDVPTLQAFPFIDMIVRGEADDTLPKVLRTGVRSQALAFVGGVTFRSGKSIVRNPEGSLVSDLDALPFPAYDLLPEMDALPYFSLELGRGCPFACTFCSTNDFFRRRFRLKSPDIVLAQMRRARAEYRADNFDLVHDMFTVDRKRVVSFCQTLIDSGEHFGWSCSARTDCIDDELIELMQQAGCRGVFFGIETGSPRLQRVIEKDLDLAEAASRVRTSSVSGLNTTVSLITGFPEETEEDLCQTIAFLIDSARYELVEPQLHIVAPLAGTPLEQRYRSRLLLDDVYSDISYQGWKQDGSDRALIAEHPDIFPNFYGIPVPGLDRTWLKRLRIFVLRALERFRWLTVALHQSFGGMRTVFENWETASPMLELNGEALERYYASVEFTTDFVHFVRRTYLAGTPRDVVLKALLQLGEIVGTERSDRYPFPTSKPSNKAAKLPPRRIVPFLCEEVRVFDLEVDIRMIIDSLRRGDGLPLLPQRRVTLATRKGKSSAMDILELTPLSASFLQLCDGRTLDRISALLEFDGELESLGRGQVAALAFQELCDQRLLTWRATRGVRDRATGSSRTSIQ